MRVFVAGASGAIGRRLIPMLVKAGYEVTGMTRSAEKAPLINGLGADHVAADALDASAVESVVRRTRPEVVVHQLTAIPSHVDMRHFDRAFQKTNELRTRGTDHLLSAAVAAGAKRIVAQSFGAWAYARQGGPVKSESEPLDTDPPAKFRNTLHAILYLEHAVASSGLEGVLLRYGFFYGPGTSIAAKSALTETVRRRRFPIIGPGTGVWSFIHIDDAAAATVAAVERASPGIYNIADDEPAPVSEWVPALARALDAKPPLHFPAWLAAVVAGPHVLATMNEIRGLSNVKAKWELGWKPRWSSWRAGFRFGLEDLPAKPVAADMAGARRESVGTEH